MTPRPFPDLYVTASEQITPHTTLHLAERLLNLDHEDLSQMGERLIKCVTNEHWWKCGLSSVCPRCAKTAAIRDRRALTAAYAATPHARALVTATLRASRIVEGHRALVTARRALKRSSAHRGAFLEGRGRIEVKRTDDDDGWLVHSHEIALVRSDEVMRGEQLAFTWTRLLGGEVGSLHVKPITERGGVRTATTFRSAFLLRDEAEAIGAAAPERRRAARVGDRHAGAALRRAVQVSQ